MIANYSRRHLTLQSLDLAVPPGRQVYRARLGGYRNLDGFPLPTRIELSLRGPDGTSSLRIAISRLQVNPELPGNPFSLSLGE